MTADWIASIADISLDTVRDNWARGEDPWTLEYFHQAIIEVVIECNELRVRLNQAGVRLNQAEHDLALLIREIEE